MADEPTSASKLRGLTSVSEDHLRRRSRLEDGDVGLHGESIDDPASVLPFLELCTNSNTSAVAHSAKADSLMLTLHCYPQRLLRHGQSVLPEMFLRDQKP